MSLPPASVIVASRGRPELLRDTVRSLLEAETPPADLVVVDQSDAADPALEALAAAPGVVRYLWSRTKGLSRANNLGVREARHDLLVFTHDDVLVEPTWYGRMVAALLAGGPRAVITGRVLPARPETSQSFAPSVNPATEPAVYEGRIFRDVLYPLNMALHRAALEAIGGFDERLGPGTPYPAAEDNDLGYRLLEAGYRILFEPAAVVHHRAWRPRSELARLRYAYGRGQGAFYAKHLDWRDRYMLRRLADDVVGRLWRLPGRMRRKEKRLWDELSYVRGVLSALARWWAVEGRT